MEGQAGQNAMGLGGWKDLIERASRVRVEVVLLHTDILSVEVGHLNELLQAAGILPFGTPFGHLDVAPAG